MGASSIHSRVSDYQEEMPAKEPYFVVKPKIHESIKFDRFIAFHAIFLVLAGILQSLQGSVNGALATTLGGGFSAWFSFCVGIVILVPYFLIESRCGRTINFHQMFKQAPWWSYIGGICGAIFVLLITLIIPYRGSSISNGVPIVVQLVSSVIYDHFGWFGLEVRRISLLRLFGAMLMIAGILMISLK
ncbi:hypothetical protein EV182_004576 [Spiromyces aspiralis]|uniref:Uncharacterized protein n=1 Tax=Spiromyces aspiralis TaxID=68401 RepID=A0ACC1HR16_9FUNG|nr:hypothetical protein EV182_004576 [Spiromyces aspiralis]